MSRRSGERPGVGVWGDVLDAAYEVMLIVDADGTVRRANLATARLTGYPVDAIEGSALIELSDGHGESLDRAVRAALTGGSGSESQIALRGKSGPVIVDIRTARLTDCDGDVTVLVCGREIEDSEIKQSLAETGGMLGRLQSLGSMGLWVWDVRTGAVQWSAQMHAMHGVPPEEFGGDLEAHLAVVDVEARPRVAAALERAVERCEPYDEEFPSTHERGRVQWIGARAEPRVDADGRCVAVEGIHQDLSERFAAEEVMRLALERERRAVEELTFADRLKDEFLDTVSHELRTPLSIVSGYAEVLLRDGSGDTSRNRSALEAILRNARQLQGMVAQILDLSRLEAGRVRLATRELSLAEAVDGVLAEVAEKLADHEVRVVVPDDLRVDADPMAMSRILVNLLTNAAKFSPAGTTVTISASEHEGDVIVSVADQGIGVPPGQVAHLFDRFFKVDRESEEREGFGLGLAIARRYAELQGGRIWAECEEALGSTFSFSLPAR